MIAHACTLNPHQNKTTTVADIPDAPAAKKRLTISKAELQQFYACPRFSFSFSTTSPQQPEYQQTSDRSSKG